MLTLFGILIILVSVVLGLIILIQNPKGGGLSSTFGGFGNQLMGVKQTTDVLEKGTWVFGALVAILCIISPAFVSNDGGDTLIDRTSTSAPVNNATPAPATQGTLPGTDTTPKP